MFRKFSLKIGLAAAVILVMVTGQTSLAATCTFYNQTTNPGGVTGGGLYVQPGVYHHMTLTIVNLTNAKLMDSWAPPPVLPPPVVGATHGTPPFSVPAPISIDPLRSSIWAGALNDYTNPRYNGSIPWVLKDSSGTIRAQFSLDFAIQGSGTWISISPAGWNGWCAPGVASAACGGVYRTEQMHYFYSADTTPSSTNSLQMHSVMTLGNANYVVGLFAADIAHVVLVVREVQGDDYYGFNLDFVDHESSVPGDCNN